MNQIDIHENSMAKHAKSFNFASQIFNKEQYRRVNLLYAFCRYVDDLADENAPEIADKELTQLFKNLDNNPLTKEVLSLGVPREQMKVLIEGALFDVKEGRILTEQDLITYCYKVAGIVGLMMCPIIGVDSEKAKRHAIDLGIGMQLTNISRDILEDAENNRCYIPETKVHACNFSKFSMIPSEKTPYEIKVLVKEMLETADLYYKSGYKGLSKIPLRARIVIVVAGEVYRGIGKKIAKNNYEVLRGRTYLTKWEKFKTAIYSLRFLFKPSFWIEQNHEVDLHKLIDNLPGTHRRLAI